MVRRLLDDDDPPPGAERLLLPDLPPVWGVGRCGLAVALQAALAVAGQRVSYPWLMGSLGAAFMLRVEADFRAELAVMDRWRHVAEALARPVLVLADPSPQEALARAQEEFAARRPVLALGWGQAPPDWALLWGVEGAHLLGGWPGSGSRRQSAPWTGGRLLLLGAPGKETEAAAAVLHRASGALVESQAGYEHWRAILSTPEPYGPPLERRERMLAEQWLVQCLVEAREAGGIYLAELAELFPEETAPGLLRAAALCRLLADDLESLLTTPDSPGWPLLAEDEEWLQQRRERLQDVQARETQVRELLARALRGEGLDESEAEGEDYLDGG